MGSGVLVAGLGGAFKGVIGAVAVVAVVVIVTGLGVLVTCGGGMSSDAC